jgi:hypothetical protein
MIGKEPQNYNKRATFSLPSGYLGYPLFNHWLFSPPVNDFLEIGHQDTLTLIKHEIFCHDYNILALGLS